MTEEGALRYTKVSRSASRRTQFTISGAGSESAGVYVPLGLGPNLVGNAIALGGQGTCRRARRVGCRHNRGRTGRFLAWRSLADADVANSGSVRFDALPGARGTLVRVDMQYSRPGHVAGAAVALLFNRSPRQQIDDDLRRLKQVLKPAR